jgi:hypothetical protein
LSKDSQILRIEKNFKIDFNGAVVNPSWKIIPIQLLQHAAASQTLPQTPMPHRPCGLKGGHGPFANTVYQTRRGGGRKPTAAPRYL